MILDANLLLYARNASDPRHERAAAVLEEALNGPQRAGLPWQTLTAFLRIATHPRVFPQPLTAAAAADQVEEWLAAPSAWVPRPSARHAEVLLGLVRGQRLTGALVPDAHLAALPWSTASPCGAPTPTSPGSTAWSGTTPCAESLAP